MSAGSDATQMIKGLVLLAAVALDVWQKSQNKPSITGLLFPKKQEPGVVPSSVTNAA
jgi:putative multiple sugar transport system permease protein